MDDPEENAIIVAALQCYASVIAQKSLADGFGLTVAEAMWKARPVVACWIGAIETQIVDAGSARERVRDRFTIPRSLLVYLHVIRRVLERLDVRAAV
jgi:hypothetical protein